MKRAQRVLVVTCLASALFADRFVAAAPIMKPEVMQVARKLAGRLVLNLRRTMPVIQIVSVRSDRSTISHSSRFFAAVDPLVHAAESSPFQFRLPPPVL